MTPERIEQLATHREGFEWCLSVIPMGAGRLLRVRVRGAAGRGNEFSRVDETREVDAAGLATEIEALCRTLGVRLATKRVEVVRMEKLDLADIDLADVIEAKQARLNALDDEAAKLDMQRDSLRRAIEALEAAAGIERAPALGPKAAKVRQLPKPKAVPKRTTVAAKHGATPGRGKTEAMRQLLARDPSRSWRAPEIAAELGFDAAFCGATLCQMCTAGEVERVAQGTYRPAARGAA